MGFLSVLRRVFEKHKLPAGPDPSSPDYLQALVREFPPEHREAIRLLNMITHDLLPDLAWYRSTPQDNFRPEFIMVTRHGGPVSERARAAELAPSRFALLEQAFAAGGIETHEKSGWKYPRPAMFVSEIPRTASGGYRQIRIEGLDLTHLKHNALLIHETLNSKAGLGEPAPR